jgi:hypothetical protein
MEKITQIEVTELDGTVTKQVIIDKGNGEVTGMTKEAYDKQQAEQSTPSVTNGD